MLNRFGIDIDNCTIKCLSEWHCDRCNNIQGYTIIYSCILHKYISPTKIKCYTCGNIIHIGNGNNLNTIYEEPPSFLL